MTYAFITNTILPIEAFTKFGINAKPNSSNPIGFFGTGLKYGVSIILRNGGTMRVLIDGVEYEFYLQDMNFRGKMFKKVRMKKRGSIFSAWRYFELPFTTELGKNWELWQAYREIESNTRDENGESGEREPATLSDSIGKTIIEVTCNGFNDVAEDNGAVFMRDSGKVVFENRYFKMYDAPSKYVYYRGVRVHDMRYPARFTYDFNQGIVELSEDRSARNSFMMFWHISRAFMSEIYNKSIIYKALNHKKDSDISFFEGHDLSFSSTEYGVSDVFRDVARQLSMKSFTTPMVRGAYMSMISATNSGETIKVSLTEEEWEVVKKILGENTHEDGVADILKKLEEQA